ncbi:MAG: DUF4168 domain-containing protein [Leptolyngbyaceae cyanobacterium bins.59]|nr:DUF4168 domain-containing protein [Leptolyngbyaceae cyanobacterium bins.59]
MSKWQSSLQLSLAIAATVFVLGVDQPTPDSFAFSFGGAPVQAQTITDAELKNYARVVMAIEPIRQTAYSEIKRLIGDREVPPIICNKQESLKNLPTNTRNIAVNYCNQSKRVVESNGLTIARFNAITARLQQGDEALEKRIQTELLRLQRPAPNTSPRP